MIGIYKITNPNNKIYIGQSIDIEKRLKRYKNLNCKKQSKIYNSLNKYGVDNHIFEIVEECEVEQLNIRERYYQDLYDVLNKGLNLILTGTDDKNGKFSEEHKEKLSILKRGNNNPHYGKKGKDHYLFGRKLSEEHKKKISEKSQIPHNRKKVICTKTLKIWKSVKCCADDNNIVPAKLSTKLNNIKKNDTSFVLYDSYISVKNKNNNYISRKNKNMSFNLNEKVNTVSVFNNGVAGKAVGVNITVEKRKVDEPDSYPDYKLVVSDESGGMPINQGFYINSEDDDKRQQMTYQRVKSIADAVVPEDFVYPEVNGYIDAMNTLFKVIKENADGKKVDVFVTYGYTAKPSKYLGLRMFNFIQKQNASFDRLKPSNTDILERPEADAPKADGQGTQTKTSGDIW